MTVVGTVTGRMKAGTARFVQAGREIDLPEAGYVAF
jgi:hypothetical protein